jgi:hypothetical protein
MATKGKEMFVSCDQALKIARAEIKQTEAQRNLTHAACSDASLGQPVLVEDVFKAPSYWIVPLLIQEQVAGFVMIASQDNDCQLRDRRQFSDKGMFSLLHYKLKLLRRKKWLEKHYL